MKKGIDIQKFKQKKNKEFNKADVSKSFYCNGDDGEYNNNPCSEQCCFCKQAEFLNKNV